MTSEALRLAEMIERYNAGVHSQAICEDYLQAASELRRLHEVNAELLDALEGVMYWDNGKPEWEIARNAIAKATGESK